MRKYYLQSAALAALLIATQSAYATDATTNFSGDISPFSGDIDPFSGDINPFSANGSSHSGDINPFSGDINPFSGDIDPFYGDISPFWGDIEPFWGGVNPFAGDISSFWGDINVDNLVSGLGAYWEQVGPAWGDINTDWAALQSGDAGSQATLSSLANDIENLIDLGATTWGDAILSGTGQSYDTFAKAKLAEYGIDLADPNSLANIAVSYTHLTLPTIYSV